MEVFFLKFGKRAFFTAFCMLTLCLSSALTVYAQSDENEKLRVMPLGDSITDGFSTQGGYRVPLCKMLEDAGISDKVDFVGPNWGGNCYDPQHAGYSGYTIDNKSGRTGLYSFIDSLMQSNPADVVFLQIGTNDILDHYELDTAGDRLEKLVDAVLSYLPDDGMLYLATLPVMDASNTLYISPSVFTVEYMDKCVDEYNVKVRALVDKKQGEGKKIKLAEVNGVLTKADLYDGVHPSEAGYGLMAKYWYNVLTEYMSGISNPDKPVIPGDLNDDLLVDALDMLIFKRCYTLNSFVPDSRCFKAADCDGNGGVDASDMHTLSLVVLGKS